MEDINLLDFFVQYPDIRSDGKNKGTLLDVYSKKEIYINRLDRYEKYLPTKGEKNDAQHLMSIIMNPNTNIREMIIAHKMGTGKSCLSSAIQENFKNMYVGGMKRKPALVLVKNDDLARSYRNEVEKVCTVGIYDPYFTEKELEKGITPKQRSQRIKKMINQSYQIFTYETFLKTLPKSKEFIKEHHSNRVIILDEPHNLKYKKKIEQKTTDTTKSKGKKRVVNLYNSLHTFLHSVENCVVLPLSGTLMWDHVYDVAGIMNLILPLDDQLPVGKNFMKQFFKDGKLINEDVLAKYFYGRISYLRPVTSSAETEEVGIIPDFLRYTTVYPCIMSDFQSSAASDVKSNMMANETLEQQIQGGSFSKDARDIANFAYPIFDKEGNVINYTYGKKGFEMYCVQHHRIKNLGAKKRDEKIVTSYEITNRHFRNYIKNNLYECSAKMALIVEEIKNHPDQLFFIYTGDFASKSGAILIGLILEIHGLVWAKTTAELDKTPTDENIRRLTVITSKDGTINTGPEISSAIHSINRYDNRYAARCQVLVGSKKIGEGISLKNFRNVIIVSPFWNMPSVDQPIFRILRYLAQEDLKPEERKVRVMRLCSVDGGTKKNGYTTPKSYPPNTLISKTETIDMHVLKIAENKEIYNSQVTRVFKKQSFDCAMNYKRNVIEQDKDYTKECDYERCNYSCQDIEPSDSSGRVWRYDVDYDDLDVTNYNLLYNMNLVPIIKIISRLFNRYNTMNIHNIIDHIPDEYEDGDYRQTSKFMILKCLDAIIENDILIPNRLGVRCYLNRQSNVYFLAENPNSTYDSNMYNLVPIISDKRSMKDVVNTELVDKDIGNGHIQSFVEDPNPNTFKNLSYKTQIILFEDAFIKKFPNVHPSKKDDTSIDFLLRTFEKRVFKITMKDYFDYYVKRFSAGNVQDKNFQTYKKIYNDEKVLYVHSLFSEEFKGISYDVASKQFEITNTMRWYDEKNKRWNFINDIIFEEYLSKYNKELERHLKDQAFDDNPYDIFGWISKKDKKFRINLKPKGTEKRRKGIVCETSRDSTVLMDIFLNNLKSFPPLREHVERLSKDEAISLIKSRPLYEKYAKNIESKSTDYIRNIANMTEMKKGDLCSELKIWLKDHNLLYSY
jgi:hypothetical protein